MYQKRKRCNTRSLISHAFIFPRRGQVTLFIILGIILVLALVVVVFVTRETLTVKPEELVTTGKGPVADYIANCIKKLGEEALSRIGEQGGYVDLPQEIAQNGYVHLKTSPFTAVPYWAYGTTRAVPSLQTVTVQIDSHIQQNLRECVFGPGAFTQTYNLVEKSDITADTNIVDAKVIFAVHWDIEVQDKQGEIIQQLIDHGAESPVKLKRLYDTAVRITDVELRDLKLEDITQDLIALEHPNVPVVGFELSCSSKQWKVDTVKQTMQDLLRVNIGQLKVKGTSFVEFPEELPYYQNHYIWDVGDDLLQKSVTVDFHYDASYPFTFDVHPRSGSTMKSSPLAAGSNPLLSAFCAQSWKFSYDVSYPVLITLRDETTGYLFKTALTVHLKRNIPDRKDIIPAVPLQGLSTYSDEQFCDTRNTPITVTTAELVDNGMGVSYTEPVERVNVTYSCLQYQCSLGQTEYDYAGVGDVAARQMNVPFCANAVIRGQKVGYKDGWTSLVVKAGVRADIQLVPVHLFPSLNISILKHTLLGDDQLSAGIPLAKDETVIIKLRSAQRNPQTNQPLEDGMIIISPELSSDIISQQPLEFLAKADFMYAVDVTVLRGEEFIGGYKGNWTVLWDQLAGAQRLTIHIISEETGTDTDLFGLYAELEEKSKHLPLPEFGVQ
ncbi:hypothetical protein HYT55_01560 [Candidatus Woesearchaeota archaeon]|nr:hypothetical protein [Candidatus Woesearchaeota archaeon]